jgi:hypothetical protein
MFIPILNHTNNGSFFLNSFLKRKSHVKLRNRPNVFKFKPSLIVWKFYESESILEQHRVALIPLIHAR